MAGRRWWHLLFALTMAVMAGVFVSNSGLVGGGGGGGGGGGLDERVPLAGVLVMSAAYAAVGRRGFDSQPRALVLLGVMLVCSGVGAAHDPNMAIVQCIAMPLIWTQLDRTRDAVAVNALLAAAIALGMSAFSGFTPQSVVQAVLIESISFVGSICLGLWITRIFDLSDERRRLLDDLRAAQSQVAALSHEAGATSERERLARDLHGTIAQSLTGLVLLGQRASRELAGGDTARAADSLALIEETARDALVETRALVASSAPVDLDAGLPRALERLGERFARETRIAVDVHADLAGATVRRDVEVVLLRTAQEALANVRKHSGARAASIDLRRDGVDAVLTVADDGCGFSTAAVAEGFGLAGVRARIELVGGTVSVVSGGVGIGGGGGGVSSGVRLSVSVPVAEVASGRSGAAAGSEAGDPVSRGSVSSGGVT